MSLNKLPSPIVIRRPLITIAGVEGGFILTQLVKLLSYDEHGYYDYDHIAKDVMGLDSFDLTVTQLRKEGYLRSKIVVGYGGEYQLDSNAVEKAIEAYKFSPLELGESIVINPNLVTIAGTLAGGIILEDLSLINMYVEYKSFETSGMTLEEFNSATQVLLTKSLVEPNTSPNPPTYKLDREVFDKAIEKLQQPGLICVDRCQSTNTQENAIEVQELNDLIKNYFKEGSFGTIEETEGGYLSNKFLVSATIRGFGENAGDWIGHKKALEASGLSPEVFKETIACLLETNSIETKTDSIGKHYRYKQEEK